MSIVPANFNLRDGDIHVLNDKRVHLYFADKIQILKFNYQINGPMAMRNHTAYYMGTLSEGEQRQVFFVTDVKYFLSGHKTQSGPADEMYEIMFFHEKEYFLLPDINDNLDMIRTLNEDLNEMLIEWNTAKTMFGNKKNPEITKAKIRPLGLPTIFEVNDSPAIETDATRGKSSIAEPDTHANSTEPSNPKQLDRDKDRQNPIKPSESYGSIDREQFDRPKHKRSTSMSKTIGDWTTKNEGRSRWKNKKLNLVLPLEWSPYLSRDGETIKYRNKNDYSTTSQLKKTSAYKEGGSRSTKKMSIKNNKQKPITKKSRSNKKRRTTRKQQ